MVGAIIGAAAQTASAIGGAIASSAANKKAREMIGTLKQEKQKWYDQQMAQDYTQRLDVQNILRKQRELLQEQYQRSRATNLVAGGTDESLALQQASANNTMGDTMADIASQASSYKEGVEQQHRADMDAIAQQEIALQQQKAQNIASAAGQMGSAVSGLMTGAVGEKIDENVDKKTV